MDLALWRRLSIRLFEADYVWAHHNFSDVVSPNFADLARPDLQGIRLRTGIVLNFGYPNPAIPAASCSIQPSEVMVGEPVTVTANATNFNPKHTLTYNWTGTGGKVTGKDTTATIDTNGVAGGSYTVTSHVVDPKMKKNGEASCTANYTVKEPPKNPPTMSCSANPTSVQAGTPSTVTCSCTSPGQRSGHGQQLDRERRHDFRRRQYRYAEHHRSTRWSYYSECDLHGFSWPDRPGFFYVP